MSTAIPPESLDQRAVYEQEVPVLAAGGAVRTNRDLPISPESSADLLGSRASVDEEDLVPPNFKRFQTTAWRVTSKTDAAGVEVVCQTGGSNTKPVVPIPNRWLQYQTGGSGTEIAALVCDGG